MSEERRPASSSEALRRVQQRQRPRTEDPSSSPPPRYEMLDELGRGGVGVVYRGRDVDLSREVAMKVLHPEFADNPDVLERFVEEAQIGGQLQHPGIVPVYEIGVQADERPFFAMKLVKGVTLWAQLSERQDIAQDRQQFLAAFAQVCQTMAFAHARRVVHRDLKPENVMIGAFGEVQVVDWGFAKVLPEPGEVVSEPRPVTRREPPRSIVQTVRTHEGSGSKSMLGSVFGTPAYMPPEQALGDIERMDRRSDVFGLGAILCEILTGFPPYVGSGHEVLMQAARADLADALRRLDACGANEVLIELCRRCLHAAPEQRPADAQQVADEVLRYQASVEQRARDAEIAGAEARVRARAIGIMSAAALLVLLLGGGAYLHVSRSAAERSERATARAAEARATASVALGEARSAGLLDVAPWRRAATTVAEAVALSGAEDVSEAERSQTALLAEQVARESDAAAAARELQERDAAMRLAIAAVFGDAEGVRENASVVDLQRLRDRTYAERFRDYLGGRELDRMSIGEAATAIENSSIAVELAAAIDDWAFSRRDVALDAARLEGREPDLAGVDHLRAIARAVDPTDPWRNRLRSLFESASRDPAPFVRLFDAADWDKLPAASVRVLFAGLWDAGERHRAVAALERGLLHHPDNYSLAMLLGVKLGELPEPRRDLAVAALRTARAIAPSVRCDLHMAFLLLGGGHLAQAESVIRQVLLDDPDSAGAHNVLGLVFLEQKRWDEAQASFEMAQRMIAPDPAVITNLGTVWRVRGDYARAEQVYEQALEIDADYVDCLSNLAGVRRLMGRYEEGVKVAQRALELDPLHVAAITELAHLRDGQAQVDEARRLFERALELSPRSVVALVGFGDLLRKQGENEAALQNYRRAAEVDPDEPVVHGNLAGLLADLGRGKEGLDYLDAMQSRLGDSVAVARGRSMCQLRLGRPADAEATLLAATERFPKDSGLWFELGQVVGVLGRHEEAAAHFVRSRELGNNGAEVHSNLAASYQALQQWDNALQSARRAVELAPSHAPSRLNLSQCLLQTNQVQEGLEQLRRARDLWSRDATGYGREWYGRSTQMLASQLNFRGLKEEALSTLAESVNALPEDFDLRVAYALMLHAQKQGYAAQAQYERIVATRPDHAQSWMNLASISASFGKATQALAAAHRAEELFAAEDTAFARTWRQRARTFAQQLSSYLETSRARLPIARGEQAATTLEESVAAASSAYGLEDYAAATSGWRLAFEQWPKAQQQDPYVFSAACCAALAAMPDDLTPAERAAFRAFALACLRADMERIAGLPRETPAQRGTVREHLQRMLDDPDLVAVRSEARLARMPVEEVGAFRELWREVGERLAALDD